MKKKHFITVRRVLVLCLFATLFMGKASAQVSFMDSSIVTSEAFYYWKADDAKPYHYGASINPHGNCVKTSNGYVFYTWYKGGWDVRTLMVSRKKIGSGSWVHVALPAKLSLVGGKGDTHLTTNVGICPIDGTVHLMFDHHNENLNYIRSKKDVAFGPDANFTAANFLPQQDYLVEGNLMKGVSYPDLFNNDAGEMYFERRRGAAIGGNIIMTYYNGVEWSDETMIIQGTGAGVSQGECNFCYGTAKLFNGKFYYSYSPRWAESPTQLGEGVYLMELGARMNDKATSVAGKSNPLPIIDHVPYFIADPRGVPDDGWAGGPQVAISPKNDIYMSITPRKTTQFNYLKKSGETEFTMLRAKGDLGEFYGNRMYKFVDSDGFLLVKSCLAGTYDWRTDYRMSVGSRFRKSVKIMNNGTIVAVYAEAKNSEKVPIHCFVFQIEKEDYTQQTITFSQLSDKIQGDANFALSASATSNLPVTYTSSNTSIARIVDGNKVKIVGVGNCNIMANQAGDGIYDYAPEVSQALIVKANAAKASQTIQFSLATTTHVWGNADEVLSASASSGLPVVFESSDPDVAVIVDGKLQVKRAGTATISALQDGDASYNCAPVVSHELSVPRRKQIITFQDIPEVTSQDPVFQLKATSNNPNAKLRYVMANNQVGVVWTSYVVQVLGAGTGSVTVSEAGDDYYLPAEVSKDLVVKPKIHQLPAQIEAEYYTSLSGVGVKRWSNTVFYLNNWATNRFAEYTIDVPTAGTYDVVIQAAGTGAGKKLKIMSGTKLLNTVGLTVTPSLTRFKTSTTQVSLEAGVQKIKFVGVGSAYNVDWMKITPGAGVVLPPDTIEVEEPVGIEPRQNTIVSADQEQDVNLASNLYDGKLTDDYRWTAQVYPKSVVIDLGAEKEIVGTKVWTYKSRAYQYSVELSNSPDSDFSQIVDRTANTATVQPISDDVTLQKGRYIKLTVTGCDAYGGDWISINELLVVIKEEAAGIDSKGENAASVSVFPNPTNSSFKVLLNGISDAQVQIFNLSGQMVYEAPVSDQLIDLPSGVYLVNAIGDDQKTYQQKLIVQ